LQRAGVNASLRSAAVHWSSKHKQRLTSVIQGLKEFGARHYIVVAGATTMLNETTPELRSKLFISFAVQEEMSCVFSVADAGIEWT
jgi:NaMN:DMB phosphoribosyltransferase